MAGIYLHIPFCKQACFYCDFHFSTSLKKKDELISCLIKELEIRKDELQTETIETIYFGGGTPSLLYIKEVELLLNAIYKNYNVIENPEITLEANPDDLPEAKILELAKSSVNRLSIGIQSFFEDDLKLMNRAHNANEAKKCLTVATHHFDNITVDLIYGIQNMSIDKWKVNLQTVFDFGINHISSYALTVEPNTALDSFIKNGKYLPLNEELAKQHFNVLVDETEKQGFVHYEISNFGKPNYFSKHNTSYWKGKKYIGIGPSAHSFNETQRSWNVSSNAKYIKSISENKLPNELEKLSKEDVFNEYIMTGLRTIWGVSLEKIKNDFGETYIEYLENQTKKHIDKELLYIENQILKTTKKGKFLADGIASDLFILN
ncbi:MAG: radical SAM family heme chaperone HemW [Polaribacter sp.]|nr:radical SAM family heme chaperone HemW [Polaribacter sp.]MDG1955192.1 radical SAM family heme chaperone HemW [Polaribacter sp.]